MTRKPWEILFLSLLTFLLAGCVGIDEAKTMADTMSKSSAAAKDVVGKLQKSREIEVAGIAEYRTTIVEMATTERQAIINEAKAKIETLHQASRVSIFNDYTAEVKNLMQRTFQEIRNSRDRITQTMSSYESYISKAEAKAILAEQGAGNAMDVSRQVEAMRLKARVAVLTSEYNRVELEALIAVVKGVEQSAKNVIRLFDASKESHLSKLLSKRDELLLEVSTDIKIPDLGDAPQVPQAYEMLSGHLDSMKQASDQFSAYLTTNQLSNQLVNVGNIFFTAVKLEASNIIGNGGKIKKSVTLKDLDVEAKAVLEILKSGLDAELQAVSDAKKEFEEQADLFKTDISVAANGAVKSLADQVTITINEKAASLISRFLEGAQ